MSTTESPASIPSAAAPREPISCFATRAEVAHLELLLQRLFDHARTYPISSPLEDGIGGAEED